MSTVKFGGGGIKNWGCFSMFGLIYLDLVKTNVNPTAYKHNLDSCMIKVLWHQFGKGPFLFQFDHASWLLVFGVEELQWPAERPDLSPTEKLCDELEHSL